MDRLKYFLSEFDTQGRRGEKHDVTALGRWAVGTLGRPWTIRFRSISLKVLLVQNYDLFRRFDAHFVSGADHEKSWADDSHIAHTCSLRSLVVPFQVFGPWPWSWPITIKQIVRFQERMHLEKFQVDKIKNGHYSPRQAWYCGISWKPLKIATPSLSNKL